jgi:hypothetical protein
MVKLNISEREVNLMWEALENLKRFWSEQSKEFPTMEGKDIAKKYEREVENLLEKLKEVM